MRGIIYRCVSCGLAPVLALASLIGAERWPGVKVTYFANADLEQGVLTTYEPELRHDGWAPVSRLPGRSLDVEPYAIRYETGVQVDQAGTYTFRPDGDHGRIGFKLYVQGRAVPMTTYPVEITAHGKTRTVQKPISEPIALPAGTVPLRLELTNKRGFPLRKGYTIFWRRANGPERPIPPGRLSVEPWPEMRYRPILRYAMVGHSNVEGRTKCRAVEARRAWRYNSFKRLWTCARSGYGNHTSGLIAGLSEKYPTYHFGGIMLGKGGSNVCDQWLEGQLLDVRARRVVTQTAWCGPLLAMGSHFDWDEIKRQEFIDSFEKNYSDLITRFRTDLGRPDLPWLFTRLGPGFCTWGPGGGGGWGAYKSKFFPGPDNRGSPGYNVLYHAADSIAAKLPPMRVVTVDDFVERWENRGKKNVDDVKNPDTDVMHYFTVGFEKWTQRAIAHLEDMGAIEAAIARLDAPAKPFAAERELPPRWPVSSDSDELILAVRGEITRVSKPRSPQEMGPYPDTLMSVEYRVLESSSRGNAYLPERIVILMPAISERKLMRATTFKPGMVHTVGVASWEAQPEAIQQRPIDDDIAELELPLFYALTAHEKIAAGKMYLAYNGRKIDSLLDDPAE